MGMTSSVAVAERLQSEALVFVAVWCVSESCSCDDCALATAGGGSQRRLPLFEAVPM